MHRLKQLSQSRPIRQKAELVVRSLHEPELITHRLSGEM